MNQDYKLYQKKTKQNKNKNINKNKNKKKTNKHQVSFTSSILNPAEMAEAEV